MLLNKGTYPASTSGLLCLSTTCEAKFSKHIAAVKVALTAFKYGLKVLDYRINGRWTVTIFAQNHENFQVREKEF